MTYYHNTKQAFAGQPHLSLLEGEICTYEIEIVTPLANAIRDNECFIYAEGSQQTITYDSNAWLASWYVIRPEDDYVIVSYFTDKEIRALTDTVKIQTVAIIIHEMRKLGYEMQTPLEADYAYHAYHHGCDLVFKRM